MPEQKPFPFKLGADPEFTLKIMNRPFSAHYAIPRIFESQDGNGIHIPAGNIGWDGADRTGELRPKPGHTPKEVADNLETMFKHIADRSPHLRVGLLSEVEPLGGHVHLEIPARLLDPKLANAGEAVTATAIRRMKRLISTTPV